MNERKNLKETNVSLVSGDDNIYLHNEESKEKNNKQTKNEKIQNNLKHNHFSEFLCKNNVYDGCEINKKMKKN